MKPTLNSVEIKQPPFDDLIALTLNQRDDARGWVTAFRHAANSLALEAGIIPAHIDHDEAAKSVCGDHLYLELIAEAELRLKRLSTGYERLRAAAFKITEAQDSLSATRDAMAELLEVLENDLS
jgi:hypothetical protein